MGLFWGRLGPGGGVAWGSLAQLALQVVGEGGRARAGSSITGDVCDDALLSCCGLLVYSSEGKRDLFVALSTSGRR